MTSPVYPAGAEAAPEFRPFFEGLKSNRISFPKCRRCGRTHWYPLKRCPHCMGAEFDWPAIAGPGRLYSWTIVRRPFSADFVDKVPYTVGLVEFDEVPGTRLITNIVGCEPERLTINAAVEPIFVVEDGKAPTVLFRLSQTNSDDA